MAKRENFYRRDPSKALAGMIGLSLEERGVYNTVLDLLYSTWRPLEDDRAFIANWCGCAVQKLNPIIRRLIERGRIITFTEGGRTYLSDEAFEAERASVKGADVTRSGRAEVGEKSGEVGEKSTGVEENPPSCFENDAEKQAVTPLEKTRVEKRREEDPQAPKGAAVADADVELIWTLGSKTSRERSSKAELRAAMVAQTRKGRAVPAIISGVAAYLATEDQTRDDGRYQQGIHRLVKGDRWVSFVADEPPPLFRTAPAAAAAADEIGSLAEPGPRRQRSWMQDWRESQALWRDHERGPRPGQVGCRVWPEIQREFGVEPAAPQPVRGAA